MASARPMQHISREELHTSLEARIQYLHSFLDFSSSKYHPALYVIFLKEDF